jgi:hypothetical protein
MTLPRVAPWLGLAAVGWLGWLGVRHGLEAEGALKQQIRAREQTIAVLAKQQAATAGRIPEVDTVLVGDKAEATRWAARYAALRDSLRNNSTDSGTITPLVIRAADSTIASCDRALHSCDAAIAVRDTALWQAGSLTAQQDTLIRDLQKRTRGFRVFGVPLACVGGYVGTMRAAGPGIGCGVPLLK